MQEHFNPDSLLHVFLDEDVKTWFFALTTDGDEDGLVTFEQAQEHNQNWFRATLEGMDWAKKNEFTVKHIHIVLTDDENMGGIE